MDKTSITKLFNIKYPIIQAGMIWVSGAKLAAACANEGILGLIGAGSMSPKLLREHIKKAKKLTSKPFGVNIPLMYKLSKEQINTAIDEGIKIFFTSAGSPKLYTQYLKDNKCIVVHVTSTPNLAIKCQEVGVDAIVAEGVEAGGHNGPQELTTMALIPQVKSVVNIPVISAGGIASGQQIVAAMALGADGVQIGTAFAATYESSGHKNFKDAIISSGPEDTKLVMKKLIPVRLLENLFRREVEELEQRGASKEELKKLLGKGRAKKAMFEGDLENGEIEVGQVSSMVKKALPAKDLVKQLIYDYNQTICKLKTII